MIPSAIYGYKSRYVTVYIVGVRSFSDNPAYFGCFGKWFRKSINFEEILRKYRGERAVLFGRRVREFRGFELPRALK